VQKVPPAVWRKQAKTGGLAGEAAQVKAALDALEEVIAEPSRNQRAVTAALNPSRRPPPLGRNDQSEKTLALTRPGLVFAETRRSPGEGEAFERLR